MALPDSTKGAAATLNDAINAFAAAWAQVLSATQPARLQRAMELAQAVEHKDQSATSTTASQQHSLEHTLELAALGADVVRDAKAAEQPERARPAAPTTGAATAAATPAVTAARPGVTKAVAAAGNQRQPAPAQRAEDTQKPPRKIGGQIKVAATRVQAPAVAVNTLPAAGKSNIPTTSGPIRPALHPVRTGPPTLPTAAAPQIARAVPAQIKAAPLPSPPGTTARS
jgi:hypothetical protein